MIGEIGYENSPIFLLPFFFLEKKEIRKVQGRYKEGILERNNMDPEHVINEMGITGSTRESILYLLHLRLLYCSACLYCQHGMDWW